MERDRRDRDYSDRNDRYSRDRDDDFDGGMGEESRDGKKIIGGQQRKKPCRFCTDNDFRLDYKNIRVIGQFITEHGRIVPRRVSGICADHQRKLTTAIKRARNLALVGYVSFGANQ